MNSKDKIFAMNSANVDIYWKIIIERSDKMKYDFVKQKMIEDDW